jgi:MFS transporter, NNP family, nitrate/nitrite transporter
VAEFQHHGEARLEQPGDYDKQRDAPGRPVPDRPALARLAATLRLRITWQASALYAVGFGGFVAFSVYLPTYLKNAYLLTQADAANKMAGFVLLAVPPLVMGGIYGASGSYAWGLLALAVVAAAALAYSLTTGRRPATTRDA